MAADFGVQVFVLTFTSMQGFGWLTTHTRSRLSKFLTFPTMQGFGWLSTDTRPRLFKVLVSWCGWHTPGPGLSQPFPASRAMPG